MHTVQTWRVIYNINTKLLESFVIFTTIKLNQIEICNL